MTTIWKSCPKSIKIKASKQPFTSGSLSGVVAYQSDIYSAPLHVSFLGDTQKVIARHMPMGIGPAHPAYLTVTCLYGVYRVWCSYVNEDYSVLLWQQNFMPEWCSASVFLD
jgi:hypothetical protein